MNFFCELYSIPFGPPREARRSLRQRVQTKWDINLQQVALLYLKGRETMYSPPNIWAIIKEQQARIAVLASLIVLIVGIINSLLTSRIRLF